MRNAKEGKITQFHPKKARCPIQSGVFNLQQGIEEIARFPVKTLAETRLMWSDGSESDVSGALEVLAKNIAAIRSAIENERATKSALPVSEAV